MNKSGNDQDKKKPPLSNGGLLNLGGEIMADDFLSIIIESPYSRQQSKKVFF
jgi:hypothetical protein